MLKNKPRILFFTKGLKMTPEEESKAEILGPNVGIRNASYHPVGGTLEACAAVAGEAPEDYRKAFPYVNSAAAVKRLEKKIEDGEAGDGTEEPPDPSTAASQGSETNQGEGEGNKAPDQGQQGQGNSAGWQNN